MGKRKKLRTDIARENEDGAIRHLIPDVVNNTTSSGRKDLHGRAKQNYKNQRTIRSHIPIDPSELD